MPIKVISEKSRHLEGLDVPGTRRMMGIEQGGLVYSFAVSLQLRGDVGRGYARIARSPGRRARRNPGQTQHRRG